jgi:protein TonB
VTSRALAVREGVAPVRDRLLVTFFFAALVHALLILGLTFSAAADESGPPPGLQVLLVSDEVPESQANDTATYLAQRTQRGSGNTLQHVAPRNRAGSVPVPEQPGVANGTSLTAQGATPRSEDERVLTSTAWNPQVRYFAEVDDDAGTGEQQPIHMSARHADEAGPEGDEGPAQLTGPKRDELWITPDSRAATLAPYLDAWRHKVERIGTLNYPTAARRSGVTTSPILEVAIDANGNLEKAAIRQSSGDPELDQASLDILKLASPFDPFPPELERQYHVLRFAYEWEFVGGRVQAGGVSAVP